jgi:hypothetical protein
MVTALPATIRVPGGRHRTGTDRHAFVQPPKQVNHSFATAVIVDHFEFDDIAPCLHHFEKLNNDFVAGPNKDLALTTAFGIWDGLEGVSED